MSKLKQHSLTLIGFILGTSLLSVSPEISAQDSQQNEYNEVLRLGRGTANDIAWRPDGQSLVVGGSLGVWFYDNDFNEIGYLEMPPAESLA
jgi:hypothetical protein